MYQRFPSLVLHLKSTEFDIALKGGLENHFAFTSVLVLFGRSQVVFDEVLEFRIGDIHVVSVDSVPVQAPRLIQGAEPDPVLLIELRLVEGLDGCGLTGVVKPKPLRFNGVKHRVPGEFNQNQLVELRQVVLVPFLREILDKL